MTRPTFTAAGRMALDEALDTVPASMYEPNKQQEADWVEEVLEEFMRNHPGAAQSMIGLEIRDFLRTALLAAHAHGEEVGANSFRKEASGEYKWASDKGAIAAVRAAGQLGRIEGETKGRNAKVRREVGEELMRLAEGEQEKHHPLPDDENDYNHDIGPYDPRIGPFRNGAWIAYDTIKQHITNVTGVK